MRLSVVKGDPGYSARAHRVKVYLDGAELKHCVTADEEQGLAVCYRIGPDGKKILKADLSGVETVELRGTVHIEFAEFPVRR